MYTSKILFTAIAASSAAQAFDITSEARSNAHHSRRAVGNIKSWLTGLFNGSNFFNGGAQKDDDDTCPAVWKEISTQLTAQFLADGECTDAARAAIRASFHDCFNGACDGSLILSEECSRPENGGLQQLCGALGPLAEQNAVGVADLIQFAAAHAVKTCPGGPTVPVKVGRKDSSEASPRGILPQHDAGGGDLIKSFGKLDLHDVLPDESQPNIPVGEKGFTPVDIAALIGAHTVAKQRGVDRANAGASLDSTVGTWDNKFYQETKADSAPFVLQADKNIAQHPLTALPFSNFAVSKGAWDAAFVSAMTKLSMVGVDPNGLIDCTSALPGGSRKREIKSSNLFDRIR